MDRLVIVGSIVLGLLAFVSPSPPVVGTNAPVVERALILEQNQGEVREWRPLPSGARKLSYFIIKVDKQNGGSPDLWLGTENMPPGAEIRYHRHLHEDEVLYVGSGIAHVHVGSLDGVAHTGSIIFIPRNSWLSVKNVGKTPIALLFAFNAPGFDRFMRCESVSSGQPVRPLTDQQDEQCAKLGDVEYRQD